MMFREAGMMFGEPEIVFGERGAAFGEPWNDVQVLGTLGEPGTTL